MYGDYTVYTAIKYIFLFMIRIKLHNLYDKPFKTPHAIWQNLTPAVGLAQLTTGRGGRGSILIPFHGGNKFLNITGKNPRHPFPKYTGKGW